jgi:hypothetical protein
MTSSSPGLTHTTRHHSRKLTVSPARRLRTCQGPRRSSRVPQSPATEKLGVPQPISDSGIDRDGVLVAAVCSALSRLLPTHGVELSSSQACGRFDADVYRRPDTPDKTPRRFNFCAWGSRRGSRAILRQVRSRAGGSSSRRGDTPGGWCYT